MRQSLKLLSEPDHWRYGLSEEDFNFIERLTREYIAARKRLFRKHRLKAEENYPDPTIHEEIISDIAHYDYIDAQYLWQFCLWRFQGILEGLIVYTFLPDGSKKGLLGLQSKLNAMKRTGYSISDSDFEECLAWARLRNLLSHSPPEQFNPGPLTGSDITEYKNLLLRLISRWKEESDSVKGRTRRCS